MKQAQKPGIFIGHIIGASFGVVFIFVNLWSVPEALRIVVALLAIVMACVILAGFIKTPRSVAAEVDRQANFNSRAYWLTVLTEAVALVVGNRLIVMIEKTAILGWVAFVIGVHFLAFAKWWLRGNRDMRLIGSIMVGLGAVGMIIAFSEHDLGKVTLISGIGSGLTLLGVATISAVRALRTYSHK